MWLRRNCHRKPALRATRLLPGALLPHLAAAAEASRDPALVAAAAALTASLPEQSGGVICHGDLHPLNLIESGERLVVLDWTGAVLAPPGYDLAATWLLLRHPTLVMPAALRPAIAAAARYVARSFLRCYRAANPGAELGSFGWYARLHALRILSELAIWRRGHDPRAHSHPWRLLAPPPPVCSPGPPASRPRRNDRITRRACRRPSCGRKSGRAPAGTGSARPRPGGSRLTRPSPDQRLICASSPWAWTCAGSGERCGFPTFAWTRLRSGSLRARRIGRP
ncbi:phosphotransferase family protein [Nonomuraea fuscirosea]|uniref:phosphotransferase family protein n=1 Tax=Nonomuraea fuscirosea TaxID=1291556 RepID=UPI0033DC1576